MAKSGKTNTRNFCATCGSRLWADLDLGFASVSGGSLDDPDNFQPTMIHCENDAPNWGRVPSQLESLPEGRWAWAYLFVGLSCRCQAEK